MAKSSMPGLRMGFSIVDHCARSQDGIGFSELRETCGGASPSTMSRILKVLMEEGVIEKRAADGRYSTGANFAAMARNALGRRSLADIMGPIVADLAEATRESAAFYALDGKRMRLVCKREMENSFHYMDVGMTWGPLWQDPFGLVCLRRYDKGLAAQVDIDALREFGIKDVGKASSLVAMESDYQGAAVAFTRRMGGRGEVTRVVAPAYAGVERRVVGSLGITMPGANAEPGRVENCVAAVERAARKAGDESVAMECNKED